MTEPLVVRRRLAAGLCVSPLMGGLEVNGELLAAPFVVAGTAGRARRRSTSGAKAAPRWRPALAGAATVAALLVKQNMADVGVFAAVLLLRRLAPRRGHRVAGLRTAATSYGAGAVLRWP